jgi:hypothetical protein
MPARRSPLRLIAPVALLVSCLPAAAAAQAEPTIRVVTRAAEVSIGGRVQAQFSTSSADEAVPALWEMRRVRLEMAIRVNPLISARLNPEFSGPQVALRDAFVQLDLGPAAQVQVGQAFRPFGLIAQTSSVRILPIERGARFRGIPAPQEHYNLVAGLGYADRDVGLQVRGAPPGAPLGLTYGAGVFNGPAVGAAVGTATYQLAARATIAPLDEVRLGAGWSRRHFAGAAPGEQAAPVRAGAAWEIDAALGSFAGGPNLLAEAAFGTRDPWNPERRRFRAAQLWAAYRSRPLAANDFRIEPVLRVSHGDPDASETERQVGGAGGLLLTPGLNLYAGPLNRVMVNYDFWSPAGDAPDHRSFRVMFQAAF